MRKGEDLVNCHFHVVQWDEIFFAAGASNPIATVTVSISCHHVCISQNSPSDRLTNYSKHFILCWKLYNVSNNIHTLQHGSKAEDPSASRGSWRLVTELGF